MMFGILFAFLLSFASGVTRTVARMLNAQLGTRIGVIESTFFNFIVGLTCSVIFLLFTRGLRSIKVLLSGHIPLWAYCGGVIGVIFVVLSNIITPRISAFSMNLLIFVGQIATGISIDAFVRGEFHLGSLVGGCFIFVGLIINLTIDRRNKQSLRTNRSTTLPPEIAHCRRA